MGDDRPEIYYTSGAFLVFDPEHALELRNKRIVGQMTGLSSAPYFLSQYASSVALMNDFAKLMKLSINTNVDIDENKTQFAKRFATALIREREEFMKVRETELRRRNIPVTAETLKDIDERKMRLSIPELPDSKLTSFDRIEVPREEMLSLLNLSDPKTIIYHDLFKRGFYISSGMKFGCDFLVYPGDPVRYHAQYAARFMVAHLDGSVNLSEIGYNEINGFQRLANTANKIPLFVTIQDKLIRYWTLKGRQFLGPHSDHNAFESINPYPGVVSPPSSSSKHRRTQ